MTKISADYRQIEIRLNLMMMIITCAIIASTQEFGFKNKDFGGLSPGPEALKTIFDQSGQGCRIISVYQREGSHDCYRTDSIYWRKGFLALCGALFGGGVFFRLFCGGGNYEEAGSRNSGSGNPHSAPPGKIERAGQATGKGIERGAKATERGVQRAGEATRTGIERGAKATERGVKRAGEATGKGIKKAGEAIEKTFSGD